MSLDRIADIDPYRWGYRGRKTLFKQWLSRSRSLVTEQEREHRVCRSELAAVSEESREQVSIAPEYVE